MADIEPTEGAEEVPAVDYSTMTETQLAAKQQLVESEIADLRLKADAREATPADSARFDELKSDLRQIKGARASLAAMLIDDEPEAPAAVEPVAEPVEVTEATEPVAEVAEVEVPELVAADISDDVATGTGPIAPASEPEVKSPAGPAIFASLDGSSFTTRGGRVVEATTMDAVAERFSKIQRGMRQSDGKLAAPQHIMTTDAFVDSTAPRAMAGDSAEAIAFNTALVHGKIEEAVMADCRNPIELETSESCSYRTDTPFWDIFRGNVNANACSFKWKRNYNLEDIAGGVAYWDACKQALCDPADETTWKPLAELPPCDEDCYSTAEAFYLTWGLKVTVDDMFCRADRIQEANELLAAYRAVQLDNIARSYFDAHAANDSNVWAVDLASFGTDLGLVPALQIALAQFVQQFNKSGRFTCDESGKFAVVPSYVTKHIAIDLSLAGENANAAESVIRDAFSACGINDVIFDDDYGCEGNLSGIPEEVNDGEKLPCSDWNCTDNPFDAIDGACPAFESGAPLVPLTDRGRIRIGHRDAFLKGSTGVVDYELRQDTPDLRKNQATYFGESRHFLFPRGDLMSGVLDFTNACPNGNRIDRTAAIDCAAVVAAPATK